MLKARIITGLLLAGSFLFVLLHPDSVYFYVYCGAALVLAAWEWAGLFNAGNALRAAFALLVSGLLVALSLQSGDSSGVSIWVAEGLVLALPVWALLAFAVFFFPRFKTVWNHAWLKGLWGILVIVPAWMSLIFLREHSFAAAWIVLVIALVAFADIGAYFAGRRFGSRKLAVDVSPGKTWEGFWGGMCAALVLGALATLSLGDRVFSGVELLPMLAVAALVSTLSVIGDLSMSMLKRVAGVKDSGSALPGHGGVLDRIDGMLAAVPIFAWLLWVFGW